MKIIKCLVMCLMVGSFLIGCSEEKQQIKGLISKKEGTYNLLVVGDELDGSELTNDGVNSENVIDMIYNSSSLKTAQEDFSTLNIENSPVYIVFDNKGEVFRTDSYEKLVDFFQR